MLCVIITLPVAQGGTDFPSSQPESLFVQIEQDIRYRRAIEATSARAQRQVLLRVKTGVRTHTLQKKLPRNMRVIASQGPYVVIQSEGIVQDSDLKRLRSLSGVARVDRDGVVVPQEDCPDCRKPNQPIPLKVPDVPQIRPCQAADICPNSGKAKLWAQERVDADLMQVELARLGVTLGNVKVAVVDSGFDMATNQDQMVGPFKVEKGHEQAADASKDEDGHGTMVSSLISAKNGLGIAPGAALTTYRVTEKNAGGSTTHATLRLSIEKACADGNEIINVSWGGLGDETGIVPDEQADRHFLQSLADRGCLVVKSAGNSAYRDRKTSANNPDDPYLRVAAISNSGNMSQFSSPGEISAPGSGVFTLESKDIPSDQLGKGPQKCGVEAGRFVNGTSFAAPITAAIAAQVIGVLRTGNEFATLPGPERIKLVNRILIASQNAGTVNGLRAVLIAERWVRKQSREIPNQEQLQQLLQGVRPDTCREPFANCQETENCNQCIRTSRLKLAVCEPPPPEAIAQLIQAQIRSKNLEGAAGTLYYFNFMNRTNPDVTSILAGAARELWNAYTKIWSERDPKYSGRISLESEFNWDSAKEVLGIFFNAESDPAKIADALHIMVRSYEMEKRMNVPPEKGGDEERAIFRTLFKTAAKKLGSERLLPFLSSQIQSANSFSATPHVIALEALITDETFQAIQPSLLTLEKTFLAKINQFTTVPASPLLIYGPMLQRNQETLAGWVKDASEKKDYSGKLGPISLQLLLEKPELLPEKLQESFLLGLVSEAAVGTIRISSVIREVNRQLEKRATDSTPEAKAKLKAEFQRIILTSQSFALRDETFPSVFTKIHPWDKERIDQRRLVDQTFLISLARQSALMIADRSGSQLESFGFQQINLIEKIVPYLVSDPNPNLVEPAQIPAPAIPDRDDRAESLKSRDLPPRMLKNQTIPEILDSLLASSLNALLFAYQNPETLLLYQWRMSGLGAVEAILKNPDAKAMLPANGQWKKAFEALLKDATENPDRFPESMIWYLKSQA